MVDQIVTYMGASFPFFSGLNSVLNVKALVLGTFNQEKALVLVVIVLCTTWPINRLQH